MSSAGREENVCRRWIRSSVKAWLRKVPERHNAAWSCWIRSGSPHFANRARMRSFRRAGQRVGIASESPARAVAGREPKSRSIENLGRDMELSSTDRETAAFRHPKSQRALASASLTMYRMTRQRRIRRPPEGLTAEHLKKISVERTGG